MLSTVRHALTPSANQPEEEDLSNLSPATPSLPLRHSSPPSFSPFQASEHATSTSAPHISTGNGPMTDEENDVPMDLSFDQNSPDSEQEANDDSLLGPMKASHPTSGSHNATFLVDNAYGDHLQPSLEGAHAKGSRLPSLEQSRPTSKSQLTQQTPTPGNSFPALGPRLSSTPQPSENVSKKSREKSQGPQKAEPFMSTSGAASVEPEQMAPPATIDPKTLTSSNAPQSKRKREDGPSDSENKNVKKQRDQPKTGEGSTTTLKHQGAVNDESSKKRGRPKKEEGSTATVKQQAATEDEPPKKRGRPKKEGEGSAQKLQSQRTSKVDASAKRGRPKKEAPPPNLFTSIQTTRKSGLDNAENRAAALTEQDGKASETPKKRGRPRKEAEHAGGVNSAGVPAVDVTKKRGRPKKAEGATQGTEPQAAPTADTPRKRGRTKKNEGIAEGTEPQGSSNVETTKQGGRPKATEQETPKTPASGKRGRPKKEQATPKGAKPAGIVKKRAGR